MGEVVFPETARNNDLTRRCGPKSTIDPQSVFPALPAPPSTVDGGCHPASQANKLSRTYATLLEALNRHRGKGQQKVTVEHVHIYQGVQAIVGSLTHQGGTTKSEDQPHEPEPRSLAHEPGTEMPSEVEAERETVPVTGGQG